MDEGDEWHDTAEHRDSGVRDIILTGTVRLAPFVSPDAGYAFPLALGAESDMTFGFPPLAMPFPFPGLSLPGLYKE